MPGQNSFRHGKFDRRQSARVSVYDEDGRLLSRLEEIGGNPCASGSFCAPHSLAVDSHGDLYVGEVTYTFAISRGNAPEDCHMFQKLARAR
jgi:hypothetical protein